MALFSPLEAELLKCIANRPTDNAKYLVRPEVNMISEWFSTPMATAVFKTIARDALNEQPATWMSILSTVPMESQDREYVSSLWKEGKQSASDVGQIVGALQTNLIRNDADKAITEYHGLVQREPDRVRDHVEMLGSTLAIISHDGVGYDPTPSAHKDDSDIVIGGSWGSKTVDKMFDGGVPSSGYALWVAPSGFGKSSMMRSLATYSIARNITGNHADLVFMTNEMLAGETSRRIHSALKNLWAGGRTDDQLWKDIDSSMRIYDRVYSWSKMDRILYWERPTIAIIDSLDALDWPEGTDYAKSDEKHKARSNSLAEMSIKYNCFISIPANASEENQRALRDGNLDKVQSAMAFGSSWYLNKSSWSFVLTRDKEVHNRTSIKRVKNRPTGLIGEVWSMGYSPEGKYYYDLATIPLN